MSWRTPSATKRTSHAAATTNIVRELDCIESIRNWEGNTINLYKVQKRYKIFLLTINTILPVKIGYLTQTFFCSFLLFLLFLPDAFQNPMKKMPTARSRNGLHGWICSPALGIKPLDEKDFASPLGNVRFPRGRKTPPVGSSCALCEQGEQLRGTFRSLVVDLDVPG